MARDHKGIDKRIQKLGLTKAHVAMRCEINPVTLSRIIKNLPGYQKKDTIERIHKYLDTVKT